MYAMRTVIPTNLLAFCFNFAIDGVIKPNIIKGTAKKIICPKIYFIVITTPIVGLEA